MRILVGDEALCEEHRMSWLQEEETIASEAQIGRVMAALDVVSDQPPGDEWETHLRKMALAAIGAM